MKRFTFFFFFAFVFMISGQAQQLDMFKNQMTATKTLNNWFKDSDGKPVNAKDVTIMSGQQFHDYLYNQGNLTRAQQRFLQQELGDVRNGRALRAAIDTDCSDQPFSNHVIVYENGNPVSSYYVLTGCGKVRCWMGYYDTSDANDAALCEKYKQDVYVANGTYCVAYRCTNAHSYTSYCVSYINMDGNCADSECNLKQGCN